MEQKQTNKEMVDELEKVKQEQLFALKPCESRGQVFDS